MGFFHCVLHLFLSFVSTEEEEEEVNAVNETPCDYTDGQWVPDKLGPLYNGSTCGTIKDAQNCIIHGRSDLGYLYWRWKPHKCSLPRFDPSKFFHFMSNKHIAFIGDSMARNQLESLLCILASVSTPELVYTSGEDNKFRRWNFPSHNLTVSVYWSPFLVDGIEKSNFAYPHSKKEEEEVVMPVIHETPCAHTPTSQMESPDQALGTLN
ncbi:Protein ALTERED XYLOGLUCAN 4, partial [Cucurbita argyrosperma subsp. sororia]